jgi:methyltransferase (TIGR00027 family)
MRQAQRLVADRLDRKLAAHGYDPRRKTLFIIEGLLMYIPQPAVDALLAFVAKASGPGSAFVADYFDASVVAGTSPLPEARALKAFVEQEGSALQFGFEENGVEAYLKSRGFAAVETISAAACQATFFPPAARARQVSSMFNFVQAAV